MQTQARMREKIGKEDELAVEATSVRRGVIAKAVAKFAIKESLSAIKRKKKVQKYRLRETEEDLASLINKNAN